MVAVYQQDHIAFADFFLESVALLWYGRRVDNRCGDIFGCAKGGWERDWRQDRLQGSGNEGVFDEAGEQGGLADLLVTADAYADLVILVSSGSH